MKLFPDPLGASVVRRYGLPLLIAAIFSAFPMYWVHWIATLAYVILTFVGLVYVVVQGAWFGRRGLWTSALVMTLRMLIIMAACTIIYMYLHEHSGWK